VSAALFLYNDVLLHLDEAADPSHDPSFPLQPQQIATLTAESVIALLVQEAEADPNLLSSHPKRVQVLCHLLRARGINAVRLRYRPDGRLGADWGNVPESALGGLVSLQEQGGLSHEMVEQAVWSKLT